MLADSRRIGTLRWITYIRASRCLETTSYLSKMSLLRMRARLRDDRFGEGAGCVVAWPRGHAALPEILDMAPTP